MPNDIPQTLPPDFFGKKGGTSPPQTLPPDFFATKVETPDPTKPEPTVGAAQTIKNIIPKEPILERHRMIPGPGGGFKQDYSMTEGEHKKAEQMVLGTIGGVAGGEIFGGAAAVPAAGRMLPWLMRALATSSGVGAGTGVGELAGGAKPKEALETSAKTAATGMVVEGGAKGIGAVAGKIFPKVDPLAKINKLLGVGQKELVPGKMPSSLDEFATNPARGASKSGLDEKVLAKMNPIERNSAIMAAKDKAGKALEQVLQQATDSGKTVDIYPTLGEVFDSIPDAKLAKEAENRLVQILKNKGITGTLDKLTPMQAREVQRSLDEIADFSSEGEAKSFKDVATKLRRGISQATRKSVPEVAPFDQHYGDLANAAKATQKAVRKYASTVPENKLRKFIVKAAVGGGVAGLGYEAAKHWGTPVP